MSDIPPALRKLGITTVSDNLEPEQVIDPKKASAYARIYFRQELMEFLQKYQERQENDSCQYDPNTSGDALDDSIVS
ncbi:MAG: hypothetical protein ACR2PX_01105 [Endozoicomonas sp.]|uniref:hypothetical protein n=1 Tax=Endozoicomonas sp. TaxID=1892382 RepID=UPI003D9B2FD2